MPTILYRLQPWAFVDQLVFEQRPEPFSLVILERSASQAERSEKLATADYLMGSWVTTTQTLTEEDFRAGQHLKLIQLMSAGYEHINLDLAARYGIPVAHFGGGNASVVAEHCILLMLALLRRLFELDAAVRSGAWRSGEPTLHELRGKQVGLIGLGYIGRELALRLRGFLTDMVYFARHRLEPEVEDRLGVRFVPFDELLRTSDIVSLHVQLSNATRGMLGAREFGLMRPGALFINTSRGPTVDEAALYTALSEGRLAGAGIDVFEREPAAADHPLLSLKNVVVSPHNAGSAVESWPRIVGTCYANIDRVERGEPPQHLAVPLD